MEVTTEIDEAFIDTGLNCFAYRSSVLQVLLRLAFRVLNEHIDIVWCA